MNPYILTPYLDDLERRILPQQEKELKKSWRMFSEGKIEGQYFNPHRPVKSAPGITWPEVKVNPALEDFNMMALQQLGACSTDLAEGTGNLLNVRCNYGTAILPSLFGLEIFVMDDEMNTLPTTRPASSLDQVKAIIDQGVPELINGYGKKVFEMGEYFVELFDHYPNIKQHIQVYHPDIQGPMDGCELIFGSKLFLSLYDSPDLIKTCLDLVCETYVSFIRNWIKLHPFQPGGNAHWGMYHRGNLMLREDSAMNLSGEMVQEFILPYDQLLLDEFGGGAIHFCGKGDHFIEILANMDGVWAFNLTQPELNDMNRIFRNTIDQGIPIVGLPLHAVEKAVNEGRDLHGLVHVKLDR